MLSKRAERAKKQAQAQTPEAIAAAAAKKKEEDEAKRAERAKRDEQDAQTLQQWAIKDESDGKACELIDIGANLVKAKGPDALVGQLRRCEQAGVTGVLVTGTSVKASQRALTLAQSSLPAAAVQLYCTAGVHPHDAKSCDAGTVATLRELLRQPECVAVGECGLDYGRMFSPRDVQLKWFEAQARLAAELQMPLFLHERDRDSDKGEPLGSAADLMRVLEAAGVEPERVCVHCFTGSVDVLQTYVRRGFRIGLTGFVGMRKRGAHVREAVASGLLPLEQLMVETDAPFMKPDKEFLPDVKGLKKGQCEPCLVPAVVRALAELYRLPPSAVAKATTANARRFFGLAEPTTGGAALEVK